MTTLAALIAAVALTHSAPAQLPAGAGMGEIRIPQIGLTAPLDQGADTLYSEPWPVELEKGPTHYPGTALPWQTGVTAFAGHRTTFTRPFRRIDELKAGNAVILKTPWGTFWYRIKRILRVGPHSLGVLGFVYRKGQWYHDPRPHGYRLALTACDPPGQATQRIVVEAVLTHVTRTGGSAP